MHRFVRLMVLLIIISCAHFNKKNKTSRNVDGIIFLDDAEEKKTAKTQKSYSETSKPKSQENKQENPEDVRNFKDMEGIILLDFDDQVNETPRQPLNQNQKKIEKGKASYYAMNLKGRKTASGEVYDPNKLTAAHPSLHFGTMVRVTNLYNNANVIVRINDRGPHVKSRIIDLSYAAAEKLDMISAGIAEVAIYVLSNY
jgi:rare lipoprotein A